MTRRRGTIAAGVMLLALSVLAALAFTLAVQRIEGTPLETDESAVIEVPAGSSFAAVAGQLSERGLVEQPWLLRLYARWNGLANRIQAGEYAIEPGTTAAGLVRRMVNGEVVQYSLTLIEGWRFDELLAAVHAHPAVKRTLEPEATDAEIMAAIGRESIPAEGRFLPETYHFPRGISDIDILRRANRALEATLDDAWRNRADGLPIKSADEALILASIIEKETGLAEERRRIAGVFSRRLERGMRLQTDPTVIYGLGEAFDGDLRRIHLRTDTPYNTYTRHGLPPTPIALPGAAAIRAAVDPAEGDSLYFVSRGDGSHVFSATLDEHNAAVRRYQLGQGG
ncbi:endolytic transglycosylase MltG [Spiribacter sp. 227]|uniref:Endolytic murein transglycosylase n=2 Tax=Spiribacter onubensis TaxID=3122420 RepID=A0ABV3S7Y5_9GAMM